MTLMLPVACLLLGPQKAMYSAVYLSIHQPASQVTLKAHSESGSTLFFSSVSLVTSPPNVP